MYRICLLIAVLFFSNYVLSQDRIKKKMDSLNAVAINSEDSLKFSIYNQMAFYYVFRDSIKADSILRRNILDSQKASSKFSEALLTNTYGILKAIHSDYDSAYYYYDKSLLISKDNNFKELETRAYNNIGLAYWNNGNLSQAQEYFFKALQISEDYLENDFKDAYYNNIGLIYQELEEIDKALEYHKKALDERISHAIVPEQMQSYNKIGICYKLQGEYEKAIKAYRKGLKLADSTNTYYVYQSLNNNLGNVLVFQKKYDNAIEAFDKAVKKPLEGNLDRSAQHQGYGNLAYAYLSMSNHDKANYYTTIGLENLKKSPDLIEDSETLLHTASLMKAISGEMEESRMFYDSLETLRSNKFSKENAAAIANYETKYETAQKETALADTRATLAEKELEVREKNNFIYGIGGGALLLGLFGYLFYNQQRLKNRQQAKEFELEKALVKIETQNRLQEQRLRISRDLHDNIGSQLTFITSSLDNLKYGMKEKEVKTKEKLTEIGTFTKTTINELRDTIWAMNKEQITFEDLEARLANLVDQARKASSNTTFHLDVDKSINGNNALTSVEGMNLYRIIQEAVNNAIKYAEATDVHIKVSQKNNLVEISISDNGKGFDTKNPSLGNGLTNMKKRTKDIDGELKITASVDKGTCIELRFHKSLNTANDV